MRKYQKGFVHILLILAVAVGIVAIGYFAYKNGQIKLVQQENSLSPSPVMDPTTNWKTYTSTKYGFEFKYPEEFKYLTDREVNSGGDFKRVLILQNFPTSMTADYSDSATFQMMIESKKDDGNTSSQMIVRPMSNGDMTLALAEIAKNGHIFRITLNLNKTGNEYVFNQILSTFKFIPTNSATPIPTQNFVRIKILDTGDWLSYTCGNISYKLPADYTNSCITNPDSSRDIAVGKVGVNGTIVNISIRGYDGGSRRQYWISRMQVADSELARYVRFQESLFGNVSGLDVFASGGWWQGGYASPILIAQGKTIVSIYGGRDFQDQNGGKIVRWDVTDTIASTVKFN